MLVQESTADSPRGNSQVTTFRNLDREEEISTQPEILRSRVIMEAVVDRLALTQDKLDHIRDARRHVRALIDGVIDGARFLYNELKYLLHLSRRPSAEEEDYLARVSLVDDAIERIRISPASDSNLLTVSFRSSDPQLARDVVNALVDEFMRFSGDMKQSRALNFFSDVSRISPATSPRPRVHLINGVTNQTLTVIPNPTLTKAFSPTTINAGGTSTLTFTITNGAGNPAQSGINFTDTLPTNEVVATPNGVSNTCGGTVTATAGSGSLSLSGGTMSSGTATCTIAVNVTSGTAGSYVYGAGNISGLAKLINGVTNQTLTVLGDLDGDGKIDLAVSNASRNSVSVYHNTGSTYQPRR